MDWEIINVGDRADADTHRLRIPGGWLYRTTVYRGEESLTTAMVFVSYSEYLNDHKWREESAA